jgi:predicted  nucleic acid-binding Zn-ribbon protein
MDDNKKLDMILEAVAGMKQEIVETKMEVLGLKTEISGIKTEIKGIKQSIAKIEVEHGEKLAALFDGYTQNKQQLERIENEVKKHEEVILRKVL